ncbi:LOW QUALITY PROTEIN: uncharacterized protein LOC111070384 [Drosophila obscura]|uniref:LOW QUALITY PROTEIN: uncharacterized protein LOC111070384 n=1 Tax=Drosophila obscura TaxID=7282 RepID=UPI001BB250A5|nr:LOW QUALITY PROTEIN: uncharacterized protein LOC111070384 [Drosophila obscura]
MDSTRKAMEKLLAEVVQSHIQSQEGTESTATTPTDTTTISSPNTPSQHSSDALSGLSSSNSIGSRFHIDGQAILPPLMTATKRSDIQLSKHMALQLEKKFETVRVPGGQERSEKTGNSNNSIGQKAGSAASAANEDVHLQRPQSLGLEMANAKDANIPTIQVNPPTPQQQKPQQENSKSLGSSVLTVHQRRLNNITNCILHFEREGLGRMLPPATDSLPSTSTEPATVVWQGQEILDTSTTPSLTQPSSSHTFKLNGAGGCPVQRSRSFTLEEPSKVLVEHMQRKADAEARDREQAHFQRETVESKAKRVSRSPKSRSSTQISGCLRLCPVRPNQQEQPASQQTEMSRQEQPNLDEEIELMIERILNEQQLDHVNHVDELRSYLRTHKNRFNQLVQYQHEELLRMQGEFDRQQKFLINQICGEIDLSVYRDGLSKQLSEYTSTRSLERHLGSSSQGDEPISNSMATTSGGSCTSPNHTITISPTVASPRTPDSYYSAPMADRCIPTPPPRQQSSRKCLFKMDEVVSKSLSLSSDYDPQPLSGTSAPSTPRSGQMPLRNSSLSNSKRSVAKAFAPKNRTASAPQKSSNGRPNSGPGSTKAPVQRVVGGGGGSVGRTGPKKTTPGGVNAAETRAQSTARRLPSRGPTQGQHGQQLQQGSSSKARKTTSTPMRGRNEEAAASCINAGVRGYLVRRLFRTEQVQRVVQTIRDTLIFVLNLHLETYGTSLDEEEPGNIRLKARLLQQLCSASRTLHLIFFQTSVQERMEIISRDRKRIRTKLLAMHLKQR